MAALAVPAATSFAAGYRWGGGGARYYAGGARYNGGGARYYGGGSRYYGGGSRYHGSPYGYRYRAPYPTWGGGGYYAPPRSSISFSFGFGAPPYYAYPPPAYVYHPVYVDPGPDVIVHERVYVERDQPREDTYDNNRNDQQPNGPSYDERSTNPEIDVENEPPPGTYYYDRFCEEKFSTLDEYTDHMDKKKNHPQTIEIRREGTDDVVRTLEYVGYWEVQKTP
jgi:hypothetical protein